MPPTKKEPSPKGKTTPLDPGSSVQTSPPSPKPPPSPPTPAAPLLAGGSIKPGKVQTIAILMLISGISNILWMLFIGMWIVIGGIASLGIGCLLLPMVIPPIVLGVFEIIHASKLLPETVKPVQPSQTLAILEIICILTGNPIPVVAGILALVFYSDPEIQSYFAEVNS